MSLTEEERKEIEVLIADVRQAAKERKTMFAKKDLELAKFLVGEQRKYDRQFLVFFIAVPIALVVVLMALLAWITK